VGESKEGGEIRGYDLSFRTGCAPSATIWATVSAMPWTSLVAIWRASRLFQY
jgi:hypothetical protein